MKSLAFFVKDSTKVTTDFRRRSLRSACQSNCLLIQEAALTFTSLVTRHSTDGLSAQIADQGQLLRSLGGTTKQDERTHQQANEYFMTPQSVSNLFVGRKSELHNLKQDLEGRGSTLSTRRVVIYGINGSGKTQFCCKFAQDNRSRSVIQTLNIAFR